jgi:hypothetical protein
MKKRPEKTEKEEKHKIKEKEPEKKKEWVKSTFVIAVLILLLLGIIYLLFVYKQSCKTQTCFGNALFKCSKAIYTKAEENATWFYSVEGASKNTCAVRVKVLELKADAETVKALKGKDMTCSIPKELSGAFMPEEKIEYCHGMLKEGLQDLIIQKLHLFIVQNIGQINQTIKPM